MKYLLLAGLLGVSVIALFQLINNIFKCQMSTYEISSLYASWAQVALAIATFSIAVAAYRKFLSQKLAENQLELVLKLIKAFTAAKYRFEEFDTTISGGPGSYKISIDYKNTFELAALSSNINNLPNAPVFIPTSHTMGFSESPFSYLSNPLLPNSISKSMDRLRRTLVYTNDELKNFEKYIVLGNKMPVNQVEFVKVELYRLEGGIPDFIKSCKETTDSIINWLEKYGLQDLNYLVLKPASEDLFHSPFPDF